jgi:shikimate kinase
MRLQAIIADRDFEMVLHGARIDRRQHGHDGDHQDHRDDGNHRAQPERGHAEMVAGTEQGHGAGNLAPRRLCSNCLLLADRLKPMPEWATSMTSSDMTAVDSLPLTRTVALVGLMGAGKSAIGRRLAQRLGLPFVDADDEIERAAGCSVSEFFERYGEADFRAGERRVIARLLDGPVHVLSTGGGAYMDAETRAVMRAKALTVWLRADLDVLYDRVRRRTNRPLLRAGDPRDILIRLMAERHPVYAEADLVVESTAQPADRTTEQVIEALQQHLAAKAPA